MNLTAAEALWRAGYLYGTNDELVLSAQVFERLADAFPEYRTGARAGCCFGASTAYAAADFATAERLYARAAVIATGEDQAAAYFWLGQIAISQGDSQRASNALSQAVVADPDSYFAARARDLVNGVGAFESPVEFVFEFDDAAEIVEAEAWLRQTYGVTQEGMLWQLVAGTRQ